MVATQEEIDKAIAGGARFITHFYMYCKYGYSGYEFSKDEPRFLHSGAVEITKLSGRKTILQNCSTYTVQIAD